MKISPFVPLLGVALVARCGSSSSAESSNGATWDQNDVASGKMNRPSFS